MNDWVEIPNYEDLYIINRKGEVKSKKTGRIIKPYNLYDKCKIVSLYKGGIPTTFSIPLLLKHCFDT